MNIIFLTVISVAHISCVTYDPFEYEHNGVWYRSTYGDTNNVTVLIMNNVEKSDIVVKVGKKVVGTFNVAGKGDNVSVKIYPVAYNPSLRESRPREKMKLLCQFSYPITVVAASDSYQCSVVYKDKLNQLHSIGICTLILQRDSSFCIIHGYINTKLLTNTHQVKLLATIYQCNSKCLKNNNLNWNGLVNDTITLPLVSWDHIIWMNVFYNQRINVGILIGVPKNPIKGSERLEIPMKLKKSDINHKITSMTIQILHNQSISIEESISIGCFYANEPSPFEGFVEIEFTRKEEVQCSNLDPDLLCILHISIKDDRTSLAFSIKIENISFQNKIDNGSLDKEFELHSINIPVFNGFHSVIPVIKDPIILPNIQNDNNGYTFEPSDIKIYYIFEESQFTDVTVNVKCRPFNSSRLKCPPNMLNLKPILTSLEDPETNKWSLELLIDDIFVVVTVKPLIIHEDFWHIIFVDSVLNIISGWRAPKSEHTSLKTDSICSEIYQVSLIKVYMKLRLINYQSNESMEIMLDMSENLKRNNIKISNDKADLYMIGKRFLIQGTRYGDFRVQIISENHSHLTQGDMTVYDEPVVIKDLEISCISDINVLSKIVFHSSIMTIADFNFKFKIFNNSHSCFFIVDIIFSDNSKINLFLFPKHQFSLRFITNTKIIEVLNLEDMWYNSAKFNNQQSFHIELQESKNCKNPKTIWRKNITLSRPKLESYTAILPTDITMDSSIKTELSTMSMKNKESTILPKIEMMNTKSLSWIIYALIGVVVLVLIIIFTNIIIKYNKNKKLSTSHFCRRQSLNGVELSKGSPNDKDYPPLLPPPGPQVQLSDTATIAISSPHSFWCNEPNKDKLSSRLNPFIRQSSLPVKRCSSKGYNEIAPCPPLRWANKMMHGSSTFNSSNSQEGLNTDLSCEMHSFSPMTWSVTHMDVDQSSGVGSLNTNLDDILKDPYGSRERFNKLSEIPCSNSNKTRIYEII